MNLIEKLKESRDFLSRKVGHFPNFVVVLGSGLSSVLDEVQAECELPYSDIPHFRILTVEGHRGKLVVGKLGSMRVACMQGRLHFYEGYPMEDVVFPYRAFAYSGANIFILTNASGGLDAKLKPPYLVCVSDHVNMMGTNPLIGRNFDELGPRFPDMSQLYDPSLIKVFMASAKKLKVKLRKGIYIGIHGPSYETPSEIRVYQSMGGNVVGMSTVPEAIVIRHMGKKVSCISCVTNLAAGVSRKPLIHSEVLENAKKIQGPFSRLLIDSINQMERK